MTTNSPTPAGSAMTMRARIRQALIGVQGQRVDVAVDAVLAALREPDEAMLRAVNDGWPYPDPTPVWQAMLAAATPATKDGRP